MSAAAVAVPDDKWGEVPCAFIEVNDQSQWKKILQKNGVPLILFYKTPKYYFFESIPRTSRGRFKNIF